MQPARGIVGSPLPAVSSWFPTGCAVSTGYHSPLTFANGFILSYASRLFRVLPSRACPAPLDVEHLPWGCHPSSRHQPEASLPPGPTLAALPSATFLTSSTVCSASGLVGLFHPTATYRVRSPGFFSSRAAEPCHPRLVPSRRLVTVRYRQLPTSATFHHPAHRAFIRTRVRNRRARV